MVSDGVATSIADTVVITVTLPGSPVANAGPDAAATTGAAVTLTGAASTAPSGRPLTYAWTQVSGTSVTLSDPTAVSPTFTAPTAAGTLAFSLVVSDGVATSIADTVVITVTVPAPVANAGPDAAATTGAAVTLTGAASTAPSGRPLTYAWTQVSGTSVTLSDPTAVSPTFTAPSAAGTLAFSLVVSDGVATSIADTVVITVTVPPVAEVNLASGSVATASSQNLSTGQDASKAIDGVVGGYPGDYTREWATQGGRAGSWLRLTWATPVALSHVVLYDRPNAGDQITSAHLNFSDGSSMTVGSLPNAGAALTVAFPDKTVTWVELVVDTVSASTINVGLSEFEAYGTFAIDTYTLTYSAGSGGTITGTSPQTVNHGASGTAVTAVANTGYHFVGWSDGIPTATRTDSDVLADKSLTAVFAINTYTLTYTRR